MYTENQRNIFFLPLLGSNHLDHCSSQTNDTFIRHLKTRHFSSAPVWPIFSATCIRFDYINDIGTFESINISIFDQQQIILNFFFFELFHQFCCCRSDNDTVQRND